MKITKYEHACLVIEEGGKRLIIDPGMFVKDFDDHENVCAVLITHEHPDHFDMDTFSKIMNANPRAKIFTTKAVADQLTAYSAMVVRPMETVACEPFTLAFYGGQHAPVHDSFPVGENVGVLVNETLYYPGDSYALPSGTNPPILAVPASGPWMKPGESVDFVLAIKPKVAFPTHDVHTSDAGTALFDMLVGNACKSIGTEYKNMATGESLTV